MEDVWLYDSRYSCEQGEQAVAGWALSFLLSYPLDSAQAPHTDAQQMCPLMFWEVLTTAAQPPLLGRVSSQYAFCSSLLSEGPKGWDQYDQPGSLLVLLVALT